MSNKEIREGWEPEAIRKRIAETKSWDEVYIIVDYLIRMNDILERQSKKMQDMVDEHLAATKEYLDRTSG
mgnify:CR=1 FL=1